MEINISTVASRSGTAARLISIRIPKSVWAVSCISASESGIYNTYYRKYVNVANEITIMINALTNIFLLPGNLVCDLIGAQAAEDRGMTRTLINMLFWNFVAASLVLQFA